MPSLVQRSNGRKELSFYRKHKGREPIRASISLGKMSFKRAQDILAKVEEIMACKEHGLLPDAELQNWIIELPDDLADKFAKMDIIKARQTARLGEFTANYIEKKAKTLKPASIRKLQITRDYLIDHFGEDAVMKGITEGHAEEFELFLQSRHLEEQADGRRQRPLTLNTRRKHIQHCKQFFLAAKKYKLLSENPFAELCGTVGSNKSRQHFITQQDTALLLEQAPDMDWRMIITLSRYAGMRCPSEHLLLKWTDIDWDKGMMTVTSPKTAHHQNGGSRQTPIFAELYPFLREAYEAAPDGSVYVIQSEGSPQKNFRPRFQRIIKRAGLTAWPKLFQNLRSSRQTELENYYPTHVVCEWLGNSPDVAREHYLQVTEEHLQRACTGHNVDTRRTIEEGREAT